MPLTSLSNTPAAATSTNGTSPARPRDDQAAAAAVTAPGHAPTPTRGREEVPAIRVQGVSKRYHLWKSPSARLNYSLLSQLHRTLRTVLERDTPALASIARRREALGKDFFALHDVSFTVAKGESVGLIGRNGSGKSTLLQIIVNTLRPTSGEVDVEGRIAAMLELGSGFNPEFTGRENARLNAMILGLDQKEVEERMGAIIDFADLGVFIDQPVKNYSSGMVVRLGFAVLTQIEPEILIIDEALAVGDFLFQQKCFDTIRRFKENGCTLLFVSHAMSTVMELCDRALLLDAGRLAYDGPAKDAVNLYEASALRSRFQTGERPLEILGAPPAASSANGSAMVPKAVASGKSPSAPILRENGSRSPGAAVPSADKPAGALPPPPPPSWQRMSTPAAGRLVPVLPEQAPEADHLTAGKLRRLENFPATSGAVGDAQAEIDLGSVTSPDAALQFVRIYGQDGAERDWITSEEEMTLDVGILCHRTLHDPHVGFKVRDRLGRVIFETSTLCMRESVGPVAAGQVLVTRFRYFLPIQLGEYSITVGFANGGVGVDDYAESLLYLHGVKTFHVYRNGAAIIWSGVCNLFPQVSFSRDDRARYVMDSLSEEQARAVEWKLAECPAEVAVGEKFAVTVELFNGSSAPVHSGAPHPVHLAYRWKDADGGEILPGEGLRSPFPATLEPGAREVYPADILAPETAGGFLLEIRLVQEDVRWFDAVRPDLLQARAIRVKKGA